MDNTQVKINNWVLWVDSDAYPLRNISHVGMRWIDPKPLKFAAMREFAVQTLFCLLIAAIVSSASTNWGGLVFLAGMALLISRLYEVMKLKPIYGLVLNTSGVQQDTIWSLDWNEIKKLVELITDAIGNPDTAQTIFNLNHVVSGDIIQQYGADSVGKQVGAGVRSH